MPPTGPTGPEPAADRPGDADGCFTALVALGFEPARPAPSTLEAGWEGDRFALAQERPAMGTRAAVAVRTDGPGRAEEAVGLAYDELDRLTSLLNRYDPASALSVLNDAGRLADAPLELAAVLDLALDVGRRSGGAFDPSVAPLVDLFGGGQPRVPPSLLALGREAGPAGRKGPRPAPDPSDLRAALELVGAERIRRDGREVVLERAGMRLTLDGIAKGWIVDAAASSLERAGVRDYLVDAGGDIRASGSPDGSRPWRVAVRDPDGGDAWPDVIGLRAGAVATSGSYEQFYDRARTRHHIVASALGASPVGASSVTVVAPDAATADALATAVFVLGPRPGLGMIETTARCECLVIASDGSRHASSGWPALSLSGR
jgi:FAD:protein FMN transferase